jgi:hypothetical protein
MLFLKKSVTLMAAIEADPLDANLIDLDAQAFQLLFEALPRL